MKESHRQNPNKLGFIMYSFIIHTVQEGFNLEDTKKLGPMLTPTEIQYIIKHCM
jgi:hypothetical protein